MESTLPKIGKTVGREGLSGRKVKNSISAMFEGSLRYSGAAEEAVG